MTILMPIWCSVGSLPSVLICPGRRDTMNNGTQLSTDETKGSAAAVAAAGGRFQYKDRTADAQNWAQRAATAHKNTLIRSAARRPH